MDLIQIGKFIAELRKEQGLTQEQLGEKIGVTNKTVSRWETGTYLPPADVLLLMSKLFSVSINEILSGKRLLEEEYKEVAEKNLAQTIKASSFTIKEKKDFYQKKWLKEHIGVMCIWAICAVAVFVVGFLIKESLLGYLAFLILVLGHGWRNNTMMSYVEKNAYGGSDNDTHLEEMK